MMRIKLALLSMLPALTLATTASAASFVITSPLTVVSPLPHHYHSSDSAFSVATYTANTATAEFSASPNGATSTFDYSYKFDVSHDGRANVSFTSSDYSQIDITDFIINGHSYDSKILVIGDVQLAAVSGISLLKYNNDTPPTLRIDTIEIKGTSHRGGGFFNGSVTYTAVPEPATWATFLLGFGFVGFGLRRKLNGSLKTA